MQQENLTNRPLTSGNLMMVFLFCMITIISIFPGLFGIISTIIVGFGLVAMRGSGDFSHFEVSVLIAKWYWALVAIGWIIFMAMEAYDYLSRDRYITPDLVSGIFFSVFSAVYGSMLHYLLLVPLRKHREWVEKNGVFSWRARELHTKRGQQDVQSSLVADELLKLVNLRDIGVLSQVEFEALRAKLLT